jgi:hypothetical protein
MRAKGLAIIAVFMLVGMAMARELPDAPSSSVYESASFEPTVSITPTKIVAEKKTVDATFLGLALVSTGSTFADSYTTLFARQNWLAGRTGVCNVEVQSAYLYGTHPTVARAYAVASAKSVGSVFAAFYLRKHHSKFWAAPLVANSVISLEGVTQNMVMCN